MLVQKRLLVGGVEIAVVRHADIVVMRDEVEDVLLKVCAGAGNGVNFVLPDHLGEAEAEFGRAHGPCHGEKHFAAVVQMAFVALGGVDEGGGVEMAVMVIDEVADVAHGPYSCESCARACKKGGNRSGSRP